MASAWLPPTASSIIGNAHKRDGSYCQDSFRIKHTANKKWVAIAVSDGAGSAKFAGQGSQFISEKVADALIDIGENLETKAPGHWINDSVISCLVQIRENLRQLARSDDISDYHATLVSVLLGPSGGFSIHIGDGAIFGGKYKPLPKSTISIDDGFFISKPENGEYANETFFLTEPAWVKHLRITPIPPLDWIAIATDGGCALALDGIFQPNEGFMSNLFTTIRNEKQKEWSSILSEALSDEKNAPNNL